MSFANPYNFVGINSSVYRKKIEDVEFHERLVKTDTYSGILKCDLTTLTRSFIPSTFENEVVDKPIGTDKEGKNLYHKIFNSFYYRRVENGKKEYAIPASTLKGLIRSTAEAISNSCMHIFDGEYDQKGRKKVSYSVSPSLQKEQCVFFDEEGNLADGICICCSMFGMANAKDKSDEELKKAMRSNVFRGKITFSDALLTTTPDFDSSFPLKELLSPKPDHKNFYANGKFIKGRKFYYHHPEYGSTNQLKGTETKFNRTIGTLKKDAVFSFTISFENLAAEEYGLLLTALELELGLGHKLGMGKPLGLGSCVIEVKEINEFTSKRYLSINNYGEIFNKENGKLDTKKQNIKKLWRKGIPQDLKNILKLKPGFTEIRYPIKDIRNPTNDEFSKYKKLHPPDREFSDDDTKGPSPVVGREQPNGTTTSGKYSAQRLGTMAEAFKKVKKLKK